MSSCGSGSQTLPTWVSPGVSAVRDAPGDVEVGRRVVVQRRPAVREATPASQQRGGHGDGRTTTPGDPGARAALVHAPARRPRRRPGKTRADASRAIDAHALTWSNTAEPSVRVHGRSPPARRGCSPRGVASVIDEPATVVHVVPSAEVAALNTVPVRTMRRYTGAVRRGQVGEHRAWWRPGRLGIAPITPLPGVTSDRVLRRGGIRRRAHHDARLGPGAGVGLRGHACADRRHQPGRACHTKWNWSLAFQMSDAGALHAPRAGVVVLPSRRCGAADVCAQSRRRGRCRPAPQLTRSR